MACGGEVLGTHGKRRLQQHGALQRQGGGEGASVGVSPRPRRAAAGGGGGGGAALDLALRAAAPAWCQARVTTSY